MNFEILTIKNKKNNFILNSIIFKKPLRLKIYIRYRHFTIIDANYNNNC